MVPKSPPPHFQAPAPARPVRSRPIVVAPLGVRFTIESLDRICVNLGQRIRKISANYTVACEFAATLPADRRRGYVVAICACSYARTGNQSFNCLRVSNRVVAIRSAPTS